MSADTGDPLQGSSVGPLLVRCGVRPHCSVRLGSPATTAPGTPADRGAGRFRIGLPTSPIYATPLTTPGGRARATRGGTAAAGGAWSAGAVSSTANGGNVVELQLDRLQDMIERQQGQIDCLCLEAAVLRECLVNAGLLGSEHFLVQLHRQQFAAVLRVHPLCSEVPLGEALVTHEELALDIAQSTGPPAILALRAASRSISHAVAGAVLALEASFSRSIYVCGGFDGTEETTTAERFDPVVGVWEPLPPMWERRSVLTAAVIGGQLYACGGYDGTQFLCSVERFDPAAGAWEELVPMSERRWCAAAVVLDDQLYVCGGYNDEQNLASAERFNPMLGHWELLEPMSVGRGGAAAAVVCGCLYVCGGTWHAEYLSSAERFNPTAGSWEPVASMSVRRGHAAAAVIGTRLYICGGCDDSRRGHSSAETLDPSVSSMWEPLPPMACGRASPALAVVGGMMYICGGRDGEKFLSSTERYDPLSGRWEALSPMSAGRGAAAATVLDGQLYVCGGHDVTEFRRSVERFDPASGRWELLPPMRSRRASASAVALWSCINGTATAGETASPRPLTSIGQSLVAGEATTELERGNNLPSPPSMLNTPT